MSTVIGQAEGIEHGTIRGWRQHNYRKVEQCDPCRQAHRKDVAARRKAARESGGERFKSDAQAAWYGGTMTPDEMADAHEKQRARKAAPAPMPPLYVQQYPPYPPGRQDPAWGEPIAGRDLAVGDVIVFLGKHYPIDRFEDYEGSLDNVLSVKGEPARTAYSGTWDMAIGPDRTIRILPREGR